MKKVVICIIIFIIFIIFLLIGIFHYNRIDCIDTIKGDNYTISNKYTIYYKKDFVKKVVINKEINSKNNTILSFFKKNIKDEFTDYNIKYGGYNISTSKEKNSITIDIIFDIKDADIDKLVSNNSYLDDNIKNHKLEVDGIYKLFSLDKNKCIKK